MHEQKNLFLAIGLSVAIIVAFQFLFPQQTIMTPSLQENKVDLEPTTSIDQNQKLNNTSIKTKEEVLLESDRVIINTASLKGSINLKGALLDDLILLNYKESLDENSNFINLLSPENTSNPYFIEMGWKTISKNNLSFEIPNNETIWNASNTILSSSSPVTLYWKNNNDITFNIHLEIDDDYMFQITQEVVNQSSQKIEIFPYRLIKRINKPDTINFFILHEGLISLLNDELLEKKYDKLSDNCSSLQQIKSDFCDQKLQGVG